MRFNSPDRPILKKGPLMQKLIGGWIGVLCFGVVLICASVGLSQEKLRIEKVEPTVAVPGDRITIRGAGFSAKPEENVVEFNEVSADRPHVGEGGKSLSVQVPPNLDPEKKYAVRVSVKGAKAASTQIIEVKKQGFANEASAAIEEFLKLVVDNTLGFFSALAGISVLAMAIIETFKNLLPIHRWFNRHRVSAVWLSPNLERAQAILRSAEVKNVLESADVTKLLDPKLREGIKDGRIDPARILEKLFRLATAGDEKALLSLPGDQLSGQINAAAQVALDYPEKHLDLLLCLASQADKTDFVALLSPLPGKSDSSFEQRKREAVDARNRISHQVQRNLDGFQISLNFRWKLWNQVAAFLLSGLLISLSFTMHLKQPLFGKKWLLYFFVGFLGGFIAPVAKDMVTALETLRGRRR